MFSRNARRIPWKRPLSLAVLLTAVSGSVALAAETWIFVGGTSGNDTINKAGQPGNYQIFGFAGKDTLTGGQGDNLIVGDGHCPPGTSNADYCDVEEIPGDGGDTLRGGTGNNAIFGGGGPNTIHGGHGHNYIEAGPSTNLVYGGPSGDAINATDGSSTIYAGGGQNFIDARGPGIDKIYCSGTQDTVYADPNDIVKDCAHVYISNNDNNAADAAVRKRLTSLKKLSSLKKHASRIKHPSKHR
jgi:Ca2+-binding RTX toxin-like protein